MKLYPQNIYPALSCYVYILKHPVLVLVYTGYSNDLNLRRRIKEHTKDKPGWKLVYYESYVSSKDARKREKMLKNHGSSLGHLRARIHNSPGEV